MPTNDERREVARKLRNERYRPWDDVACEIAQCVGIVCCNIECHGMSETPECGEKLSKRLADLIEPEPERTCRPVEEWVENSPWPRYSCSKCGERLKYRALPDEDYELMPYCAGCGAKVVEK